MDEQKLKVILEAEIDDAIGYVETETVEQRTKAINYYNRYEYGNEVDGRSKIVTGEVAEVVDGALPQLMRIFAGSDELGRFEPRMQEMRSLPNKLPNLLTMCSLAITMVSSSYTIG